MQKHLRGFTLVEIVIVVAVITILSTIAVVSYAGIQKQSRDNQRNTNATLVAESLERYFGSNNEYPGVRAITSAGGVSSVTGDQAATVLQLNDASALVMPGSASNITNSIRSSPGASGADISRLDYEALPNTTSCRTATTINGCESFILRWKAEDGTVNEIKSRR